jgi:uncharacterized protein
MTELETAVHVDAARLLAKNRSALIGLCHAYGVEELSLFGSALRDDFSRDRSDFDFAVRFGPAPCGSPARQYFDFKTELEQLLGRPVDLVELSAMQESRLKQIIERTQVRVSGYGT